MAAQFWEYHHSAQGGFIGSHDGQTQMCDFRNGMGLKYGPMISEILNRHLEKVELLDRLASYFGNGGLFNPEMMEHDKVRELLLDCRAYIQSQ